MSFFLGGANRYGRQRRRDNDVIAVMLLAQLLRQIDQLPVKPPVTLGIMALLGAIHFAPGTFGLYDTMHLAFQPYLILHQGAWERMWLSPFLHVNMMHLYYNLTSFLYKGVSLETTFGTANFAVIVALITVLTQVIFLGISWFLAVTRLYSPAMFTYTVGFSGTIFGLKVVLNALEEETVGFGLNRFLSLNLPWSEIVWVELFIAQLMSPNSSFLGHLSGILAGMILTPVLPFILHNQNIRTFFRRRPRFWGRGTAGGGAATAPSAQSRRDSQEELEAMRINATNELSQEELRRRRLERLNPTPATHLHHRPAGVYGDVNISNQSLPRFRGSGVSGSTLNQAAQSTAELSPDELRQRRINHWAN